MDKLEAYLSRVRGIRPDLEIESAVLNGEGLLNDVVVVNGALVFRFAKRDFFYKDPREEARVLRLLRRHLTLPTPEPFYDSEDALVSYEGWVGVYARIRERVFPLLVRHAREWAEEHFESHLADRANFEWEPKMVDTDIPAYHVLFDRARRRVSGVIDFGCAGLGDPAVDFGVVINHYGESFVERFYAVYPEAETYLRRARFYAGALELRWVLQGLERGEPFWFAAHIGGARDMKYNP